jgi:hypothetical protein
LQSHWASDVGAVNAAYGRLLVEGKLVPRDVAKGIELISYGAVCDLNDLFE